MKAINFLTGLIAFVAIITATTVWRGYVLSILWGWFVVPLFAVPSLTTMQAAGLSLLLSAFRLKRDKANAKTEDEPWLKWLIEVFLFWMLMPTIVLFGGWIIKDFI